MVKFKFLDRETQSPNEETQSPKNGKGDSNLLRMWKREIIYPMRGSSFIKYKRRLEFPRGAKKWNHILNEEIQFPYKCRRRFESPNRVGHDSRILWNENPACIWSWTFCFCLLQANCTGWGRPTHLLASTHLLLPPPLHPHLLAPQCAFQLGKEMTIKKHTSVQACLPTNA